MASEHGADWGQRQPGTAPAALRQLGYEVKAARAEIAKLHKQLNALGRTVQRDLAQTRRQALDVAARCVAPGDTAAPGLHAGLLPIGHIESCFTQRNGTPRQPGLATAARARLRLCWGAVPAHTVEGLEGFSHVWLIFHFDQNRGDGHVVKSKVHPPRLDGTPTGVFACRTPHRPNPIGLSLVELESVQGDTLHLRGADLIDGTPVLDVKPYIPFADAPPPRADVRTPSWVDDGSKPLLLVEVTAGARGNLQDLCAASCEEVATATSMAAGCAPLRFFAGRPEEAEAALVGLLQADPRSVYRKHKCGDQPYKVAVDGLDATCRFGQGVVTVESVSWQTYPAADESLTSNAILNT